MRLAFGLAFLLLFGSLFWCPFCNSKSASRASACLSNTKQLALGETMYAVDDDERFTRREVWIDGIAPYVYSETSLHAPELAKSLPGAYGYAFNSALSRAKPPPYPERAPLVYESTSLERNASDRVTSLPRPGRHGGKNNVGYADGHARRVAP